VRERKKGGKGNDLSLSLYPSFRGVEEKEGGEGGSPANIPRL